jgi:hypothetical protein
MHLFTYIYIYMSWYISYYILFIYLYFVSHGAILACTYMYMFMSPELHLQKLNTKIPRHPS